MRFTSFALFFFLSACASTKQYQQYPSDAALTGNEPTLHVVRKNSALGSAIPAPVFVNKYLLGRIGPGGHLETKIPVGQVSVSSTTSDVIIYSRAGEHYFVEVSMPLQIWLLTPDFEVKSISPEEAQPIISK